jgi:cytochrome c oxidase subunit 2
MRTIVSAGTVITIVTLIGLLVASVATGHAVGTFGDDKLDAMEIGITGHQWWWEVKYPNALAPNQQFVTANEVHIPVGTPVMLRLDTRDVIHSLWIPNLHGKRDLIPGRVNKFALQADQPGIYRAQCAEYCGLQHAHMSLVVVAESPSDFQKWKAKMQQGAPTPLTAQQQHGLQVFLGAPCVNCHNILGTDAYGTLGPDLTHVASRRTLGAGSLMNTHANLASWIVNAPKSKPGVQMPPNALSPTELQDLLAYMETLK